MSSALILHVGAGCLAILAGGGAILLRKGEPLHRAFGKAFVIAMLVMATFATYLSIMKQPGTIPGGILAGYMVATGWMTVRRSEAGVGRFERIAMLVALGCAATEFVFGALASTSPIGRFLGYPSAIFYVFGSIAALAAIGDLRMLRRGGVFGAKRIARHLWRMCFALFLATGSFFLGQQKVMPAVVRGSPILVVLGLAPLVLMIFWLVRVRLRAADRKSEVRPQEMRALHASLSNS
jgi:uncharacterized membrane protein